MRLVEITNKGGIVELLWLARAEARKFLFSRGDACPLVLF